jgi:hypothetical protein
MEARPHVLRWMQTGRVRSANRVRAVSDGVWEPSYSGAFSTFVGRGPAGNSLVVSPWVLAVDPAWFRLQSAKGGVEGSIAGCIAAAAIKALATR